MATQKVDLYPFAGFCILVILAVTLSGCTSQNAATNTPVTTPAQPGIISVEPTPLPTTLALTLAPEGTPVKTETILQTTQTIEKVSLTITSAQKQKTVYAITAPAGRIFLVLDVTIKNNGIEKGYDLNDNRITLTYEEAGNPTEKSATTRVRGGLENPILMPTTIQQNDSRTGQIVFNIADTTSGKYTINLIDDKGAPVSSAAVTI
jgi:hypothetical protein